VFLFLVKGRRSASIILRSMIAGTWWICLDMGMVSMPWFVLIMCEFCIGAIWNSVLGFRIYFLENKLSLVDNYLLVDAYKVISTYFAFSCLAANFTTLFSLSFFYY